MSFAEQLTRLQAFLDADELHDEALDTWPPTVF